MIEKNKSLFSTGEFAKLCNVSKQTLIYYDNMALFSPEMIDSKGYRYYSLSQYDVFVVIQLLKKLNTPLTDIKKFVKKRDPESFLALLSEKKWDIESEIRRLKTLSLMTDLRRNAVLEGMRYIENNQAKIIKSKEQTLLVSEYCGNSIEQICHEKVSDFYNKTSNSLNAGFPYGVIITKEALLKGNFSEIAYFFIKSTVRIKGVKKVIRPKGLYATILHKGSYESV